MAANTPIEPSELPARLRAIPAFESLQTAAGGIPAYVVGGTVRDLLLGGQTADLDAVVEGELRPLAVALGGDVTEHERFQTAKVQTGGGAIDLAQARTEDYERPGALPTVRPASLEDDLGRRDFTFNAMAVPLAEPERLIDPHGGLEDLEAGRIRVLHDRSFRDDPTRALRAARYAARLGFELESETEKLLRKANLSTVSDDRVRAEMFRMAAEPTAPRAYKLLLDWELGTQIAPGGPERAAKVLEFGSEPPWSEFADRTTAVVMAGAAPDDELERLVAATPERPSDGFRLAELHRPERLLVARAMSAKWLDEYAKEWRHVQLEIDGNDLIRAGVKEGESIGQALREVRDAKLDGEVAGGKGELRLALAIARGEIPED